MRPFASTPSNICRRESFLSGSHFSAVSARFSGLSPPLGSLVAYPVGIGDNGELEYHHLVVLLRRRAFGVFCALRHFPAVASAGRIHRQSWIGIGSRFGILANWHISTRRAIAHRFDRDFCAWIEALFRCTKHLVLPGAAEHDSRDWCLVICFSRSFPWGIQRNTWQSLGTNGPLFRDRDQCKIRWFWSFPVLVLLHIAPNHLDLFEPWILVLIGVYRRRSQECQTFTTLGCTCSHSCRSRCGNADHLRSRSCNRTEIFWLSWFH